MARTVIILFLSLVQCYPFSSVSSDNLSEGLSLSVETKADVLTSSDGTFGAGFYPVGQNAFSFAIWFNKPSCSDNCTVVWMANRDYPVNGRRSKLSLTKHGNLILTDAGRIIWSTNTVSLFPTYLKLYDSGNLVLQDLKGATLWQSFDSPTDTLLPRQQLKKHTKLVSSRSQSNYSSGFFNLYFDSDNVLSLLYKGPEVSSIYWPSPWLLRWEVGRSTNNNSRIAVLDPLGNFTSTDNFTIKSADYGTKIHRRLKIDFDGNVRLYSLNEREETWVISWQAYLRTCKIHGTCGPNSVCSSIPNYGRKCSCIPGYKMKNHMDWSLGCEPEFDLSCNESEAGFVRLRHTEFFGYEYFIYTNHSVEMCKNLCLEQCNCKGFQFRLHKSHQPYGTYCYLKSELRNGYHEPYYDADIYLKLPKAKLSSFYNKLFQDYNLECSAQVEQLERAYDRRHENESLKLVLWFLSKNVVLWSTFAIGGIEFLTIFLVWCFLIRTQHESCPTGYHPISATGFKKFTYAELEKATNGFSKEIGRGAVGIVYKGKLTDDRIAAIKRLIDANKGEVEFLTEVNTIGKLNHMNLIDLWGYCAEGKHKLLVYEYMDHGSLAENLSSKTLDCKKRFQIALGTAKGLAYLHEECLEWILHCDIKPQNILIDSNYQPKVSDFGLSWMLNRGDHVKNSKISRLRGTRGYMAPEWVLNMPITSKVDVYSYGIVLLELVTGRSPSMGVHGSIDGEKEDVQSTLIKWVKERMTVTETGMEMIIDPTLEARYDKAEMSTLVTVALQCVRKDKDARPTMGEVVQMLLRLGEKH